MSCYSVNLIIDITSNTAVASTHRRNKSPDVLVIDWPGTA